MRFRRRRRSPSASPHPADQEKRKVQARHIRALEHVLGGSVGSGFDTLCRQLSRLRRSASR